MKNTLIDKFVENVMYVVNCYLFFIYRKKLTNPGKADLIADEHQAPGSNAGAQGCRRRGGQARKAAAAACEAGVVVVTELELTPCEVAGGILTSSPRSGDFSLSSATFTISFLTLTLTNTLVFSRMYRRSPLKWTDTRTL